MLRLAFFAAGLALAGYGPAHAAVVTFDQTLDLSRPIAPGAYFGSNGAFTPNDKVVAISEGDTFNYTIKFAGNQTLTLNNPTSAWAFVFNRYGLANVDSTGTFSFLDANGNAILTSAPKTDIEGYNYIGQKFTSADFAGGLPATITFSGVNYTGTVNDYISEATGGTNDTPTTQRYSAAGFQYKTGPGAPAPLLGLGLLPALAGVGTLGLARRRRRA